ncbi:hypothetical protein J437_LFUL017106 [Ladona fulva]|uniref:Uncharacterized protein n=1 Tax=Ladona fulva TaxID=123851 RepID=A0A8K0P749_LADFU|nr:hypothetical protein J437_LFUL017106 [Ladona fulva]
MKSYSVELQILICRIKRQNRNRLIRAESPKRCSGSFGFRLQFDCLLHANGSSSENIDDEGGPNGSYDSSEVSDNEVASEPDEVNSPTNNGRSSHADETNSVDGDQNVNYDLSASTTETEREEDGPNAENVASVDEYFDDSEGAGDADNAECADEGNDAKMEGGAESGGANRPDDSGGDNNLDGEIEDDGSIRADGDDIRSQSKETLQSVLESQTIHLKCTVDRNKIKGDCSPDCECSRGPTTSLKEGVEEEPVQVFQQPDDNLSQDEESDFNEPSRDENEKNSQYLFLNKRQT